MDLSISEVLQDQLTKTLGNTIIHSLWQGLLLAAFTGMVVLFTRKSAPAIRYNLLISALLLFAFSSAITFTVVYHHISSGHLSHGTYPSLINTDAFKRIPGVALNNAGFNDRLAVYLDQHSNTIALIWFLIVCARSLQLMTGLSALYQFRRKSLTPVPKAWEARVKDLALQLGLHQAVNIAESGMAKVPMVIGWLKPLILVPAGLLTALPPEETEAILVHELAHIQRRDYLVNLLQSMMEIAFFFNPAVLWISSLIRAERENCCDDIAVSQTSSKMNYIRALVSCQEYQLSAPPYAMALKGNKGHLMYRVKRILSHNNQSLNLKEKSLLAICLVTAGLFTVAFSNAGKMRKIITTTTHTVTTVTEEIHSKVTATDKISPAGLSVGEKKIQGDSTVPETDEKAHENDHIASSQDLHPEPAELPETEEYYAQETNYRARLRAAHKRDFDEQSDYLQKQLNKLQAEACANEAMAKTDSIRHSRELNQLTAELIRECIIDKKFGKLSFKLSNEEFIVNGKKQPEEVFQKYRAKYVKTKGPNQWSWYYNYESCMEAVTVR